MTEIGAFPFLFKKEKIYFMIITNTSGSAWILPKGHPEDDLNKYEVAELETYEEAGIKGKVVDVKLRGEFKHDDGSTLLIYPLLIKNTLDEWPEQHFRQRRLVNSKEALQLVTKTEHSSAIKHFTSAEMIKKLKKFANDA